MNKVCTKCKKEKVLSDFYKDKRRIDGHMSACKKCHVKYNKNQIGYKAKWYQKNKTRLNKKYKAYNKKYRKELKPWFVSFDKANQRCNNERNANYRWYGKRGIKQLMSLDDFEYLWKRDKAHLMKSPSIDRINPDGNYTLTNCRFIELSENLKRKRKAGTLCQKK